MLSSRREIIWLDELSRDKRSTVTWWATCENREKPPTDWNHRDIGTERRDAEKS